jgi:rubrerythrin
MSHAKDAKDAVMRAMEIEKETFDFYTRAEQKTFNQAGKRIFRWLAKSEEQHYHKLSELYRSLDETGRWVFYGGSTISLEPGEGADVTFDTDDRSALEIALEIEKKGLAYFEEILATTSDPEGRAMLETLMAEEREHLRVIGEQYRKLA